MTWAKAWKGEYERGVEAAIAVIEERGRRLHNGAMQPDRTVREIRERLLK